MLQDVNQPSSPRRQGVDKDAEKKGTTKSTKKSYPFWFKAFTLFLRWALESAVKSDGQQCDS